jgi:alpha-glucosidase
MNTARALREDAVPASDWRRDTLIYHIYPRSFRDASGDGVGDLRGITEKLDYITALNVDAIWISPFVKSPMRDFGYDVSDYCSVDPLFGTLEDFARLLRAAHARGLKVLIDQVFSHTSHEHPWFVDSRHDRASPHADWYVWADAKPDGTPPNNWLSIFGGSAWQWDPRRGQYYLHNFLREQPDLNFHCPAVRDAVIDVARFWFDLGVDGFRLDVCPFYFHDIQLRDNPVNPKRPQGRHFLFNPHTLQLQRYNVAQPETLGFLERLRATADEYDSRVLLGELHEIEGLDLLRAYTAQRRLHMAYGYWLLGADRIDAATIVELARALALEEHGGVPCWSIDNHDFIRVQTRLGLDACSRDMPLALLAALTCMPGGLCVYQGGELDLEQASVPYERLVDPYGREFYPAFEGRDGSRTPMPWTEKDEHAGFSTHEPWLPIPDAHRAHAVARQEKEAGSYLRRMRQFFGWRRGVRPLHGGAFRLIDAPADMFAFERALDGERLLCVFNLSTEQRSAHFTEAVGASPAEGHGFGAACEGDQITAPPWGAYFGWLA